MKKRILGVTALVVGVLGAGVLMAAGPQDPARQGRGQDGRFQRMAEYLGLTEEQQATWKSLQEQHRAEMEPLRQGGRELHERLKAATEAENPDSTAVGAATLALKQHREKARADQKALTEKLTGTLTPEQKTKFDAFKASHPGGHGKHGGKGRRGPRPGPSSQPAGEDPAAPIKG